MQKTNSFSQTHSVNDGFNKSPLVSVIVTTKNEEKNIVNCLLSIKNQTYKTIELIVVDNFSEDKTGELSQKYGAAVYLKGKERSAQRNYGVQVAHGKYILYLDADMILSSNLISNCVAECENNLVEALYIHERIVGEGFWIKVRDFERSFYSGTLIDAVRFIRRDFFLQVGGFDEMLVGPEDWDFDRKIRNFCRTSIVYTPIFHNEGKFNISRYLNKKGYYSAGIQKYTKKWGAADPEIIQQTGISYRLFTVFFQKGCWKKLLRHPLLTTGMYSLRLIVAIKYLESLK